MIKKILTIIAFCLAILPAMAQQNNRFNPEQFQTYRNNYIRENAGLTADEAEKVLPIYNEMKKKSYELRQKIFNLKKEAQCTKNASNATKSISKITALNVEMSKLEQTYYIKMSKVIDGKKVLAIMNAEDKFYRDMLKMADNRKHRNERKP